MGLDLWFREDVQRILAALASAGEAHGAAYLKALTDVSIAFGVVVPTDQDAGRWQRAVNARTEPVRREVIVIEQDGRR